MTRIRRGYVDVSWGQVHYRWAGSGPPVVLLHDSPRSSVLHVDLMAALATDFTVFALDTAGFGNSTPLPGTPEVPDFAEGLAAALTGLCLGRSVVYWLHSSSKIALVCRFLSRRCCTSKPTKLLAVLTSNKPTAMRYDGCRTPSSTRKSIT